MVCDSGKLFCKGRPSVSCQSGELKCSCQSGLKSWHPWISSSLILFLLRRITHFLLTSRCPPAMPYPLRVFKASCHAWTITPTFWLGNRDKGRHLEGGRGSLAFYFPVLHTGLITALFPPANFRQMYWGHHSLLLCRKYLWSIWSLDHFCMPLHHSTVFTDKHLQVCKHSPSHYIITEERGSKHPLQYKGIVNKLREKGRNIRRHPPFSGLLHLVSFMLLPERLPPSAKIQGKDLAVVCAIN